MGMMASCSTETLSWLNNLSQAAGGVLTLALAAAIAVGWLTGQELDRRRTERLSASEREAQTARREAEGLRERMKPRSLTAEQRHRMYEVLLQAKGSVTIHYPVDVEAKGLAEQLQGLLTEAGWTTKAEGVMSFGPVIGLRLDVHDPQALPPHVSVLKRALETALGGVQVNAKERLGAGDVVLLVGSRPLN